jgi:uncharacterized membrane protein YjjP (DUF1212 family)
MIMEQCEELDIKDIGQTLLRIGSLLMSSGATTHRIRNTIDRISNSFGYNAEMLITNRALTLSLSSENNEECFNSLKRTSPHGVNYRIVSGISRMSWRVVNEKWNLDQIKKELDRLTFLPHYPRLLVLTLVGLSGASFCRLFGGNFPEMLITFIATFAGLFIRQESTKLEFNPYLCVFFASLTASLISGLFRKFGIGNNMEHAFSASVLFLVPGVPLINSFSDLIDGNILNGIVRGVNGLLISFAIALGLLGAMLIYGF